MSCQGVILAKKKPCKIYKACDLSVICYCFMIFTLIVFSGVSAIEVKNVAELPGGVYHLQIITPEKTMSVKIMKQ